MARLPERLETERLVLRPLRPDDLAYYTELHANLDVVRHLGGDGRARTPEQTRQWLERMIRWYGERDVGPFAIELREDGTRIGRGGLSFFEVETEPSREDGIPIATWGHGSAAAGIPIRRITEVGYVVHPDHWGKGYATEAAGRWYAFALEERELPEVYSLIHPENLGSIQVATKNGLVLSGQAARLEGRVYDWYRMTREEWLSR